jgi:hypothetical protein
MPRREKPLCLNNLAASVMKFIEATQVTTFQDVADRLVLEVSRLPGESKGEKTTRRRVYDVLNVFLAAGLIERSGKSIRLCVPPDGADDEAADSDEGRSIMNGCEEKQRLLKDKIRLLAAYKGLVARNMALQRPRSTVKLPSIFIGFNTNISGSSNTSLDGRRFEIQSSGKPVFYSPMEILEGVGLGQEYRREVFRQYPILSSMEHQVFED